MAFLVLCLFATNASGDLDTDFNWSYIDTAGDVGQYTSIAVDSEDNVHFSWSDGGHLMYANNTCVPEICFNGIDDDCDGDIDARDTDCEGYPAAANAEAFTYAGYSATASGSFNALSLLVIPVGAVIVLRFWRRKR